MKTDIEIAQEAVMEPITKVAESIGIEAEDLELYGKYKAKLSEEFLRKIQDRPNGKLILVTAINPTPAGEGKTTTTVGMGEAFGRMGKKAVIALREPSLGPCFGIKGGAAGGGYAQVVPMDELNLHFTGDFHAITSANNLLAALLDNHIQQGNDLGIDTRQIVWCTSKLYYYDIQYMFSTTLLEYRLKHNMTLKEMSSYLEVTPKMLSKYESGDYNFSLSQICDICEKLNLKLSLSIIEN